MARTSLAVLVAVGLAGFCAAQDCYADGERAQGAAGQPAVEWKPCCSAGAEQIEVPSKGWGKFCVGKDCYADGERAQGAEGFPAVTWKPCCSEGSQQVEDASKGWGKFCMAAGSMSNCYNDGERAQGAAGYPEVMWKPCCSATSEQKEDASKGWGKFCLPAGLTGGTVPDGNVPEGGFPLQARVYGASFSPFGLGLDRTCPPYDDEGEICLSNEKVVSDMSIIRMYTKRIRTYSLLCEEGTRTALKFARDHDMKVMLGLWILNDDTKNAEELKKFEGVVKDYSDVIADVVVGNEPIFILRVPEPKLAQYIRDVRAILDKLPADKKISGGVGTADIYNAWMETCTVDNVVRDDFNVTEVVEASDWIGLNQHPYWGGATGADAPYAAVNGAKAVSDRWGKKVIITETGYPTAGPSHKPSSAPGCPSSVETTAVPGVKALETFIKVMEELSRKDGTEYFLFEPFDSKWKQRWEAENNAGAVDEHWGLATCDRKMKDIDLPAPGAN